MEDVKLGERIKTARLERGFTQDRLAERLGTERGRIIAWEKGRQAPSEKYVTLLSEALGMPKQYFEGQKDDRVLEQQVLTILNRRLAELGIVGEVVA